MVPVPALTVNSRRVRTANSSRRNGARPASAALTYGSTTTGTPVPVISARMQPRRDMTGAGRQRVRPVPGIPGQGGARGVQDGDQLGHASGQLFPAWRERRVPCRRRLVNGMPPAPRRAGPEAPDRMAVQGPWARISRGYRARRGSAGGPFTGTTCPWCGSRPAVPGRSRPSRIAAIRLGDFSRPGRLVSVAGTPADGRETAWAGWTARSR